MVERVVIMNSPIKIMVAEDLQILLENTCDLINRQKDMKVVGTAQTGRDIVNLAKTTDFDIILMDIEMENQVAGIKATEQIIEENKDAKIIFLTVHETREVILSAMGTGALDYIVKGSPEEEILYHIRSVYNGALLLESKVQEIMVQEYKRLRKSEQSLLYFINNISKLTNAEREIIHLLLQRKSVKEIALERNVEIVTIKTQISVILKKFRCTRTKEIINLIKDLNLEYLF